MKRCVTVGTWSVREGLPDEVIFKKRPKRREGMSMLIAVPKGSKWQDLKAGVSSACLRNNVSGKVLLFSFMARKLIQIKSVDCLNRSRFNGS